MGEPKKWEIWMGSFLLLAVLLLSTLGVKKTIREVMTQGSEQKVVVLDPGHGAGKMRKYRFLL
ncbi:MAG: hypothetical protein MR543_00095 [Robinsoniella sp.]|nr:hypothetical protein [Robinsoniella sp.]